MAQELLDGAQVRTPFQQVGGKGVAEHVGVDVGIQVGGPAVAPEDLVDRAGGEAAALTVEEDGLFIPGSLGLRPDPFPHGVPMLESLESLPAEGHHALLAALAHHSQGAVVEVDVGPIEAFQLSHPQPRGVEQLGDGLVPKAEIAFALGHVEEAFHFSRAKILGELLRQLGGADRRRRVGVHDPLLVGVAEKAADRREGAALARWGDLAASERGEESADGGAVDLFRGHGFGAEIVHAEEVEKARQIPAVGGESMRRIPPLQLQVLEEAVDESLHQCAETAASSPRALSISKP
jgi:hypothetical protein